MAEEDKNKQINIVVGGIEFKFPHTYKLQHPIDVGTDIELREIVLRRPPTWSDLKVIKAESTGLISMDMCIGLVSKLSGVSQISLGRMISIDGVKLTEYLTPFLG